MAFLPSTCSILALLGLLGLYILKRRRDRSKLNNDKILIISLTTLIFSSGFFALDNESSALLVNADDEIVTSNDYGAINN